MVFMSDTLPSLINGVSEQPASIRLASQCSAQENCRGSVVDGLNRRPGSEFIAKLSDKPIDNAFIHLLDRDDFERYIVVIHEGDLSVYDVHTGSKKQVSFPDGKSYLSEGCSPFKVATLIDYSFIVNTGVKVLKGEALTPKRKPEACIFVKTGLNAMTYTVTIKVKNKTYTGSYKTGSGQEARQTTLIAAKLKSSLNLPKDFDVRLIGSSLYIQSENDFDLTVSDGYGDTALIGIKDKVSDYLDLPARCEIGMVVEITGNEGTSQDNYYVCFTKDHLWEEVACPGLSHEFDPATMPHLLIREADGSFTFKQADWLKRGCGDDISSPDPTFVGQMIKDIFFYRNRMGFLTDEHIVFSETGHFFNFYPTTVTTDLDTSPIDIGTTHTKLSLLNHAIPFNEDLLLFSSGSQFVLKSDAIFSKKTINLSLKTEFDNSSAVTPYCTGQTVYFIQDKLNSTGVREYITSSDIDGAEASDITKQAPHYLPSKVKAITGSTVEDMLFLLSDDKPNRHKIFIYEYYWTITETSRSKLQSAWSCWSLSPNDHILMIKVLGKDLYMVISRDSGVFIERINLSQSRNDETKFLFHLDSQLSISGIYDEKQGTTTYTLPYKADSNLQIILGSNFDGCLGLPLMIRSVSGNQLVVDGDFSKGNVYIGRPYTSRYEFSEMVVRDRNRRGSIVINTGRLQLTTMSLSYADTGYFEVHVSLPGRSSYIKYFEGHALNLQGNRTDCLNLQTGLFTFPVRGSSKKVKIELVSSSHLPFKIQNAEWEGLFTLRTRRY